MKIVCVIDSLVAGGAQRQLVELATGFKSKGHDVVFIVYHDLDFFKPVLEGSQIGVNEIIESNYLKRLFKVRKAIRKESPDAVLSFLEVPNFIATFAGFPYRKWKLVVGERSANPEILKSFKLKFYRYFHLFADYIVANSQGNINLIKKVNPFLKNKKLKVIYNSLDDMVWTYDKSFEYKKEGVLNIIIPSAHRDVKNLNGLIEAVNLLSPEERMKIHIDWYGMDKGDGSLQKGKELIKKYKLTAIFSFHNAVSNIAELMKRADLIGIFSHYEGLPNAICEGMMMGKPVICSEVSDMTHLLNKKQLVKANDPVDIKNKLIFYIQTSQVELETLGEKNYQTAIKEFDKSKNVEKYLKLLK